MPEETVVVETEESVREIAQAEVRAPYVFPFTLGADPEFTVLSGTRPLKAKEMLQAFVKDAPAQSVLGFDFPEGNIGWDGHTNTGEVRPKPGSPREVAHNLGSLFREAITRMPFASFTTLNVAYPIGGHIHLSVPKGMNVNSPKFKAMQRALASFVLLILIGENKLSRDSRRMNTSYGKIMDFKVEQKFTWPDGEDGITVEVRSPTAEWITSEKIAVGTLAFMAIGWDCILKGSTALSPIAELLFTTKQQAEDSMQPFLANFMNLQRVHLAKMRRLVRSHPAYLDYKEELELILSPDRVLATKRAFHYDIAEGWGIGVNSKDVKMSDFMKEKDVDEKTSKFPEAVMRNVSQFSWNEDLNVQMFATALSKRCVGLGWKPQHEYFLFGMKKGLDAIVIRNESGQFVSGLEILKTKADHAQLMKKFDRLLPKAAPIYGNVMNSRTGDLASPQDMQRVMIGIPYDMRQKGDVKQLLKTVIKFEKNPKDFPIIKGEDLPDGSGKVEKMLKQTEAEDQMYDKAFLKGDNVAQFSQDFRSISGEERASAALINGIDESIGGITSRVSINIARDAYESTSLASSDVADRMQASEVMLTHLIVPESLRDTLRVMLRVIYTAYEEGIENGDQFLQENPLITAFLILWRFGQRGTASLRGANEELTHSLMFRRGAFHFGTPGRADTISHADCDPFLDLLGISDVLQREQIKTVLIGNEGDSYSLVLNRGAIDLEEGSVHQDSYTFLVEPNEALPCVWA